ncbi:MAG TPA: HYR domain-containing protein [Gaiellaceae bacterium]|nr:HYR domain-containing protein [Gaiellaceae bacterium]
MTAHGTNTATATASILTVGLLGSVGVGSALAEITGGAVVQALIGPGADLLIPGVPVTVDAVSIDTATSSSDVDVVTLGLGISDMTATANVGGGTWAYVGNDATVHSGALNVTAVSQLTAHATANATSIALGISGSGQSPTASITHLTRAFAGKRDDIALGTGAATFTAGSTANSTADTNGVGVGTIQISLVNVSATTGGTTSAYIDDGTTVNAEHVTAQATGTSTATATASQVGIGLVSGAGVSTHATDSSVVSAYIGPIEGTSAASAAFPTKVIARTGVDVLATLTAHPYAHADMTSVGLLFSGAGTSTTATATPHVLAYLGDKAQVTAAGGPVLFRAVDTETAISDGSGFGVSLGVSAGATLSTADLRPAVRAFTTGGGSIQGATVTFSTRLNVDALNNPISPVYKAVTVTPAFATLLLGSIGLLGGVAGGVATATDSPTVEASTGGGTAVTAGKSVVLWNQVFSPASADGTSFAAGLGVGVGIVVPTATAGGTITASYDGSVVSANTVLVLNTVEARTSVTGRAAAGGLGAGITDATLTADTHPNVQALVGGTISSSGDVTVESFVEASAVGDYQGLALALGFAAGFMTVDATDGTHATADVLGGASVTSASGNVSVLAYHNYDGSTFLTSDMAEAKASMTSVAFGLAFNSSDLNATAQAVTLAQLDPGGTLAAPSAGVILKAISGDYALAHMESTSVSLVNIGAAGSNPVATVAGNTQANLEGNVVGPGSTPGAGSITSLASAQDYSVSDMSSTSAGLVSAGAANATAQASPSVGSTFGSGGSVVITTGNITAQALALTDADSTTGSYGGGLVQINDFSAVANDNPQVGFTVAAGANVTSQSGTITFDATHGALPPGGLPGSFDALAGVDPSNGSAGNSITFTSAHNLSTGASVTYNANGETPVGGLQDGRPYDVIVTSPTQIQLGDTFSGVTVDQTNDVLSWGTGTHTFKDGDFVYYFDGGSPINGLVNGTRYQVHVIDTHTIKLIVPGAPMPSVTVSAGAVNSSTDTISAANTFVSNQAVTYYAPTPDVLFNTVAVDQTYSGGAFTDTDNDQIFVGRSDGMGGLTDPGFSTGDAVYYTGGSIGGLSNGNVYYVIVVSTYEIRLADSFAHAMSNTYISLGPDKGSGGVQVQQRLWRNNDAPIGGLEDGRTYYVKSPTATTFKLSDSSGPGGTVDLDTGGRTGGSHFFGVTGVDFKSGAGGSEKLVIDITGTGTGTQQMIGAGGAGIVPPASGDGVVTAQATGAGGGFVEIGHASSSTTVSATVTNTVQGGATVSGDIVNVTTHGYVAGHAESDNSGGGFVSSPTADADVAVSIDNEVYVQGGSTLNATRDVNVKALSDVSPSVVASSSSGGFVAGGGGSVHSYADYTNRVTIEGTINAGATATVATDVSADAESQASGDMGGAFGGGGTTARAEIGLSSALNQVHVINGGQVNGNVVVLRARVNEERANANANAHAGAIGAGVTANGIAAGHGLDEVRLEPGSLVYGDTQIAITSEIRGASLYAVGDASCSCLGGDTNGNVTVLDSTDARVSGVAGSVLKTHDLEVNVNSASPGFGWDAEQDGGWFDVGGVSATLTADLGRNAFWESTVYLLATPNPVLTVNAAGKIVQDVNVGVTDQFANPYFLGDTIPVGRVIEVGDLVFTGTPIANFVVNDLTPFDSTLCGKVTCPAVTLHGHIWGNDGHFIVQNAWDSVTITNYSSRPLETHFIEVAQLSKLDATITITAEDKPGPTSSPVNDVSLPENPPGGVTIEFDLDHNWPATVVSILNVQPGGIPFSLVSLDGTIYNPIGKTIVRNDRGNIVRGPDAIKANDVVETNQAFFDAEYGSIGTSTTCSGAVSFCPPRSPIVLDLVWSQYVDGGGTHERPIVLNAQAGNDISLDITNILREPYGPPPVFNPVLGPIHAGGNVDIQVFDSQQGDDLRDVAWIRVNLFDLPGPVGPTPPRSGLYRVHFDPDLSLPPWLEVILRAFGTVNAPIDSAVTFSDVSAGNDIDLCHGAVSCSTDSATTIPFLVFSDVDADLRANMFGWDDNHVMSTENNAGQIDEHTNGFIVDSELNSNLRVGQIFSTTSNVGLLSKQLVLDAANDPGSTSSLDGTDVIGQDVVIFSGLGGAIGGVGLPTNFLEVRVNWHGGTTPGLLTVEDTAAPLTLGVYVTETSGNLWVNTVHTNGSAALTTLAGSILDGRNGGLGDDKPDPAAPGGCCMVPNVVANFVELFAAGGSIGQPGITKGCSNDGNGPPSTVGIPRCLPQSDFKIDSSHLITANVAMAASSGIYVTETNGAMNVVLALSTSGDIRLTVCDRPTTGDDLNLLASGFALFVENVVLPIPHGTIWAVTGNVTLQFGDNLTTAAGTQIIAGKTVKLVAGYCNCDNVGSVITLGGTIKSGPVIHLVTTVIMGTPYADSFVFNQTSIAGSLEVFGGAGDDTFTVNQLASMDVADGDSLTLDGQGGSDLYTINTAGSMSTDEHDYVVNVLDSGAPTDGSNVLVVNGSNQPDVFLLRSTQQTAPGQEPPPDPDVTGLTNDATTLLPAVQQPTAFVALLHGSLTDVLQRSRQDVERINYSAGINGRLIVNGLGGNDTFAVDDNSAITTLDGGAGDDTFLIGQAYFSPRTPTTIGTVGDVTNGLPPGPPITNPFDAFPTTDTTVGWLSRGNSYPIVAYGGDGNDAFLVLANHAALTLDGGAGNDLFALKASALVNPQTNAVVVDTFLTPTDANGAPSANIAPVYTVDATVDAIAGGGDDALYVIGTGLSDFIVQTGTGSLLGAGLHVNPAGFGDGSVHVINTGAPCTGVCASAVVSEDLEGLSGVVNQAEEITGANRISTNDSSLPAVQLAGGIGLDVAGASAGQVVITESGGSTRVYEQPSNAIIGNNDSVSVLRQNPSIDTFTVSLASPPNATVYVNVSVALGPLADQNAGDQTILVSLDGVNWSPYVVVMFASGENASQLVFVKAVDDTGREGERNATISFSSSSADPRFDGAAIRNVTVDVIDNDTRGIVVTQSGGSTTVLPGAAPQGSADTYSVAPTRAPRAGRTTTITISFDPSLISVTSSDPRFNPNTQTATFDATNWTVPVTFVVTAVGTPGGAGGTTTIVNRLGGGGGITATVPVTILPSNAPLVTTTQSNGSTLVSDVAGDEYAVRLTAAPAGGTPNSDGVVVGGQQVLVLILTDGQTLPSAADPTDTRWQTTALPNAIIVTFDATNWNVPFVVLLTKAPEAPANDPSQPVQFFPLPYALNAPADTWTVAPSLPDLTSIDAPAASNHRSIDALLCTDVLEQEGSAPGQHRDFSHATGFGCNTIPERQPVILPTERGAGVAPRLGGELPTVFVEATSRAGGPFAGPATLPIVGDVGRITLTYSVAAGTVLPLGTSRITVTAEDQGGNYATFTVTVVVRDTTPPAITAPNLTVEGNTARGAIVQGYPATATDAVGPVTLTYSIPPGSFFPLGTTKVVVTATDGAGNTSTKTFTVTVRDTTPPVITSVSPNLTVEATSRNGAVVQYAAATATDVVGPVTITYSQASGSTFKLGTTTVTVTATDGAGNRSTRTFTVTVVDRTPPTITSISGNLTVQATSANGAVVKYAAATATDAVGPVTITYSQASGSTFGFGTTVVTVTATDAAGNSSSQTFTVTVVDTTPPVITSISANLTVEATSASGAIVSYAPAKASDAVGPVTITYSQVSGTMFRLGTTVVTVTARDGHGNVTSQTFTITVRDTTPPVFTFVPADITVFATQVTGAAVGAIVTYQAAVATDAVGPVTITYSVPSGSFFPVGTTTVTVTATDGAGNKTTKTFKVTVRRG